MEERIARMQELVRFIREVRNRYTLDPKKPLDVFVRCPDAIGADFRSLAAFITSLGGVGRLECALQLQKPSQSAAHVQPEWEAYVSLKGLIDPAAESKRLDKQLGEKQKQLQSAQAKLENANFVKNAPEDVVGQQRNLLADLANQIKMIEENIRDLAAG
jgi:valyl-tRNA synthetase